MEGEPDPIYGELPVGWDFVSVSDLSKLGEADVQTGPFGTMLHARAYRETGTPVVAVKNIGQNSLIENDIPKVDNDTRDRLDRYLIRAGDILFGRKGAVERRAYVRSEQDGWLQGSDCIRLRLRGRKTDAQFISYVLGTPQYRNWITQNAHGATMPSLNQEIIGRIPLPLPTRKEQQAIACILGALDDKIELNRQMNRTLEAMARAIFKSWFVDFDPVQAKANGRQQPGLVPHIADLFPDSFENSDLGEIPRGWKTGALEDLFMLQRGFDLPTKKRIPGPYQVIAASGPSTYHNEAKVKGPGIVTGRSGVLGKVFFIQDDFWPLNTTLWVKRYKNSLPCHAYFFLNTFDLSIFNAGSAVPTLNRNHIHNLPVILPDYEVVKQFETFAGHLFKRQKDREEESNTLSDIRDALLPKLISGDLRVPDAERIVERCV